jgi:hypothetical protein
LHVIVEGGRIQSDGGNLKLAAAFQSPGQELRLNRSGIGDQHFHCLGFDGPDFRGEFCGTYGLHVTIMPKGARTVCRPCHTLLVMNPTLDVYFRRATPVHHFCDRALPSRGRSWPETKHRRPVC